MYCIYTDGCKERNIATFNSEGQFSICLILDSCNSFLPIQYLPPPPFIPKYHRRLSGLQGGEVKLSISLFLKPEYNLQEQKIR